MKTTSSSAGFDRRLFMAFLGGFGVVGLAADRLWAASAKAAVTTADIDGAANIAGLDFTEEERDLMLEGLNDLRVDYAEIRTVSLDNSIAPALQPASLSAAI
jgi:hypothetical protein